MGWLATKFFAHLTFKTSLGISLTTITQADSCCLVRLLSRPSSGCALVCRELFCHKGGNPAIFLFTFLWLKESALCCTVQLCISRKRLL